MTDQINDVIQCQQLVNGCSAGDQADELPANIRLDLLNAVRDDAVENGITPGGLFATLHTTS